MGGQGRDSKILLDYCRCRMHSNILHTKFRLCWWHFRHNDMCSRAFKDQGLVMDSLENGRMGDWY